MITDRDRVILFANDAALALVRLPASQVIGRRAASVLQDYDTTQLLARAARTNQIAERTFQRVTTGQTWRVIATPLRLDAEASGAPDAMTDIALTIEDLTELRRLETVRRDFVAHVSHELRTPLAAMKLLAETLVNALDRDPAAARGFACASPARPTTSHRWSPSCWTSRASSRARSSCGWSRPTSRRWWRRPSSACVRWPSSGA